MKKILTIIMFAAAATTAFIFLVTSSIWMNLFVQSNKKGFVHDTGFDFSNGRAIIGLLLSIMAIGGIGAAGYIWFDQKECNLIAWGLIIVSMGFLLIELFIVSYGDGGQNNWRDHVKALKKAGNVFPAWANNAANVWPVNLTFILLGGGVVLGTSVAKIIVKG